MSRPEMKEFEANPYFNDSIMLRIADDQGKFTGIKETGNVEDFQDYIKYIFQRIL